MKKVNEKRWALVDKTGIYLILEADTRKQEAVSVCAHPGRSVRLARVQITEIEEESDDKG